MQQYDECNGYGYSSVAHFGILSADFDYLNARLLVLNRKKKMLVGQ